MRMETVRDMAISDPVFHWNRAEPISDAAHRLDAIGEFPQLFPQTFDVGVQGAGEGGIRITPNLPQQQITFLDFPIGFDEQPLRRRVEQLDNPLGSSCIPQ